MRRSTPQDRGFTLIELMVSIAIVGLLATMAMTNFFDYSKNARDTAAKNDYRNIKVALLDVINSQNAPTRIAIRRAVGPMAMPDPMQSVSISPDVSVDLTYVKRYRRNRTARTVTNLDVYHREGTVRFRYRERNGVVTEQVIDLR